MYSLVQAQCQTQYEAVLQKCEANRSSLEASIRTDVDQIITSKEHVTNKIRGWIRATLLLIQILAAHFSEHFSSMVSYKPVIDRILMEVEIVIITVNVKAVLF